MNCKANAAAETSATRDKINPNPLDFHTGRGNAKLDRSILHYSTLPGVEPIKTRAGVVCNGIAGTCAGVCSACEKACYARKAVLCYKGSSVAWSENTEILREYGVFPLKRAIMSELIKSTKVNYVRAHVSGEFMPGETGLDELRALAEMAEFFDGHNARKVIFYGYTKRSILLERYRQKYGELPANLVIMVSCWHDTVTNYTNAPEFHYDDGRPECAEMIHCPAIDKNGKHNGKKCGRDCFLCMRAKAGDKIAVYAH